LNNFLNLSEKEFEIMRIFWSLESPVTIQEFISKYNPEAKNTTIHGNIKKLMEKDMIEVMGRTIVSRTPARLYFRKMSVEEYLTNQLISIRALNGKVDILKFLTILYDDNLLRIADIEKFLTRKREEETPIETSL